MFAVGKKVKAGLYSKHATLTDLDNKGDLKMATDFRRVYATIIQEWVGYSTPKEILKADYARQASSRKQRSKSFPVSSVALRQSTVASGQPNPDAEAQSHRGAGPTENTPLEMLN